MTGQASARAPIPETMLTILNGPEAGVAYKLMGQSVSLGRAPDNDVVLQDSKSSRNHAVIERRGNDYWIKDNGSTAGILVNGKEVREAPLNQGDEITVGATVLRFGGPAPLSLVQSSPPLPPLPHMPLTQNQNLAVQAPGAMSPGMPPGMTPPVPPSAMPSSPRRRYSPQQNKSLMPVVVVLVVIVGALYMMKSGSTKRNAFKVKDVNVLEEEIQSNEDTNQKRAVELSKSGKDTQEYAEAQSFYIRGFREYREGNYQRAILAFQAALVSFPNHPLARKYLDLARQKNNQLITEALQRGERDFSLEKFNNASAEYNIVIQLTGGDLRTRSCPTSDGVKSCQLAMKRLDAVELIKQNNR